MRGFTMQKNSYLSQNIQAFYHTEYTGHGNPGNPDYLNALKNTYADASNALLQGAVHKLKNVLQEDLPQILQQVQRDTLTACVVPRAKAHYQATQLLFASTVRDVVARLPGFYDGTAYITRHTDTRTTHLGTTTPNYTNNGSEPYPGITTDTCNISNNVTGKDILLVDDIYTKNVNVDEDAIQALLHNGAHSVAFYAVGHTAERV
jgi:predicted amidophosphoribosyltransferase